MSGAQARGVGVVREAEEGHVRVGVGDLLGVEASHVADDEIGLVDVIRRHEMMTRESGLELSSDVEIDPCKQDRRHEGSVTLMFPLRGRFRSARAGKGEGDENEEVTHATRGMGLKA